MNIVEIYEKVKNDLPGSHVVAIRKTREDALAQFVNTGFPSTKLEEWRFTDVAPISAIPFELPNGEANKLTREDVSEYVTEIPDATRLIFVNGRWSKELSELPKSPPEIDIQNLSPVSADSSEQVFSNLLHSHSDPNPFTALNRALWQDGLLIRIPKGTSPGKPIHIVFISSANGRPIMAHPRILIRGGENSSSSIILEYRGKNEDVYFNNPVTEIDLKNDAILDLTILQRESASAFHVGNVSVHQGRGSRFRSHTITAGGRLVRNDLKTVFNDEGAECSLDGLYVVNGSEHVDNHTFIDHAKPHCTSRELYKGILDGKARAVFNGKIVVRLDAQKTDAMQTNKNLLLSEEGRVDTKPELEIFANDVKCKHGATVGQLDKEALFYLRSRGIPERESRRLLIQGFANQALAGLPIESIREDITKQLLARLVGN